MKIERKGKIIKVDSEGDEQPQFTEFKSVNKAKAHSRVTYHIPALRANRRSELRRVV